MAKETKPKDYPKLKNYQPTRFMLPTSHYDKAKADRAVTFIENLCHTKGKWAGKRFWLLPWQEQLIRDIFGIVKPDGNRQFRTAFVEICKKVGKSELAAAIALYLLYADNEPSAEVYGAAADRQQASIVFDVARQMVEMSPALMKRSKLMSATKRIVNYGNAGFYQVLSAEVGSKHGFSISGLVFDEIHTQPNRQLYDVPTKYSSDARQNPLRFIITTAGNDRYSIAFELHTKAIDILEGRRVDPTFYPVVYGLKDDEDWEDEANWYKVNPSFDTPVALPGAVSISLDANGEPENFYADGTVYYVINNNMGYDGDLELAMIPEDFRVSALNETLEDNKVLIEDANSELNRFALLFEFDGDVKHIRHVLYNCFASRPGIEGKTNEESREVQTETLTIKATPLASGVVKAKTGNETDSTVYADWYKAVYMPTITGVNTDAE